MKLSPLMTSLALSATIGMNSAEAGGVGKVRTTVPPVTSENTAMLFNALSFGFNGAYEEFICSTALLDTTRVRDTNELCASVSKVKPNMKPIRVYNPYTVSMGPMNARIFCTSAGYSQGGAYQVNWNKDILQVGEPAPACIRISHSPS